MKMERISEQTILLANNNITSKEDLINLYKSIKEKLQTYRAIYPSHT